jgi:glycine cleavage system H protein
MFAPCSGNVIEINSALEDNPEIINSDPYGDGWIIKVELADLSELDDLMTNTAYQDQITA